MYGDFLIIRDINGQMQVDVRFEDIYDDGCYTVIDKEALGDAIGREILDEDDSFDVYDNCDVVYKKINNEIIKQLKDDIFGYVEDYINRNG